MLYQLLVGNLSIGRACMEKFAFVMTLHMSGVIISYPLTPMELQLGAESLA